MAAWLPHCDGRLSKHVQSDVAIRAPLVTWHARATFIVHFQTQNVTNKKFSWQANVGSRCPGCTILRSYLPLNHRDRSSETLRSMCWDLDRAIGVRLCNIRSAWNYGMASVSWPRSLIASDWRFCLSTVLRRKIHPKLRKFIWTIFFWTVSVGFLTREWSESSRELFQKVHVNAVFFMHF